MVGVLGTGTNAWVLATVEGIAESLTLADALGVDPRLVIDVIDVIDGSGLNSPHVQTKGPKMIDDDLATPSFPLDAAAKEAGLITDTARAAGLHLGIADVVRDRLRRAADDGGVRTSPRPTACPGRPHPDLAVPSRG
ncbi:NAD-binding protein [Streptomyces sp. 900105755]